MCVTGEIGQSCALGGAAAEFTKKKELLQLLPPLSPAELPSMQRVGCALLQTRSGLGLAMFPLAPLSVLSQQAVSMVFDTKMLVC